MAYDRCVELIQIYDKANPDVISRFSTRRSIRSTSQSPLIEIPPLNTETLPNYDYSEVVTSPTSSSINLLLILLVWPQTQINNLLSITQSDSVEINIPNIPVNNR